MIRQSHKHLTAAILLIGIFLCLICALFPPRSFTNTSSIQFDNSGGKLAPFGVTHAFLFDPDFGIYRGPNSMVFPAVVDGGRLLAELVLIASLTWIVILIVGFVDKCSESESTTKKDDHDA
jgi:hypothetical protein